MIPLLECGVIVKTYRVILGCEICEKMSGQNLMASSTIVDTDIIIDVGRGIPEAVNCLQELKSASRLAISVVTQMELIVGCANKSDYGR